MNNLILLKLKYNFLKYTLLLFIFSCCIDEKESGN